MNQSARESVWIDRSIGALKSDINQHCVKAPPQIRQLLLNSILLQLSLVFLYGAAGLGFEFGMGEDLLTESEF